MNRPLAAPDHSLNAPVRSGSEGEWQDWLADETESPEVVIAEEQVNRVECPGLECCVQRALVGHEIIERTVTARSITR